MGLFSKKREPMDAAFLAQFPKDQSIRNEVMVYSDEPGVGCGGMTVNLGEMGMPGANVEQVVKTNPTGFFTRLVGACSNKGWNYNLSRITSLKVYDENNAAVIETDRFPQMNGKHWSHRPEHQPKQSFFSKYLGGVD